MKIGTFVIGGLAGAAIVMMIQRNQTMSAIATTVGHNMKRRMNDMKDDAIEKAFNMKFASSFKREKDKDHHSASSSFSSSRSSSHGEDLDEVQKLIAQDPEVSDEINSILEENGQHRI
jgi:hypothetical protein